MGTAEILVVRVVEGLYAFVSCGVGHTGCGNAVLHGYSFCPRIGTKVVIKRAVLLHDHNYVLDLRASIVKRGEWHRLCGLVRATTTAGNHSRDEEESQRKAIESFVNCSYLL